MAQLASAASKSVLNSYLRLLRFAIVTATPTPTAASASAIHAWTKIYSKPQQHRNVTRRNINAASHNKQERTPRPLLRPAGSSETAPLVDLRFFFFDFRVGVSDVSTATTVSAAASLVSPTTLSSAFDCVFS